MDNNKKHWLTVIGIGEDGYHGLSGTQKNAIHNAKFIFGGVRHLSFLPDSVEAERINWPHPFERGIEKICSLKGQDVVVLASGDPMHYGVGATLNRVIDISQMNILPNPSSFSLAAARLGWALQNTKTITIHGRPLNRLIRYLQNGERMLVLSENSKSPHQVANLLSQHGFGESRLTVLEHLGGPLERITHHVANQIEKTELFSDLNLIAVDCVAIHPEDVFSLHTVLPDTAFQNDGQLTKQDIRAITMAHLNPKNGEILWDVGAGCGSISIEWLRLTQTGRAYAIERNPKRQQFIQHNANALGVPELILVKGEAPTALLHLDQPDAIFIGGGFTHDKLFETCWERLKTGGRLVVNSVTLETESMLLHYATKVKARLIKVSLSEAAPLGTFHVWRQSLPVTIMVATKI